MATKYKFLPSPATGVLTDEDTKKYFSRLGFAVFAFALSINLASVLIQYAHLFVVNTFFPDLMKNEIYSSIAGMMVSIICIYGIGLPVFMLVSRVLPRANPLKSSMSVGQFLGAFCITTAMTAAGNLVSNFILIFFNSMLGSIPENPVEQMTSSTNIWVTIAFGVILVPFLEELFFRRIVCSKLLPLGEGYAVFVSAAIFGLIHGNFYQFAYAFLVGALFAFIYVKTGRLIYTTILHMIVNFLGMVVAPWLLNLINSIDESKLDAVINDLNNGVVVDEAVIMSLLTPMLIFMAYGLVTLILEFVGIILLETIIYAL